LCIALGWGLSSGAIVSLAEMLVVRLKIGSSFVSEALVSIRAFQGHRPTLVIGVILAFAEQFFGVVAFYVSAHALAMDVSFLACLVVIPIAAIVARLPIALWGIGLREGIEVLLFASLLDLDASRVAAASFMMTATMYIATLPGLVLWLVERKTLNSEIAKNAVSIRSPNS
jgi:hypothetical protein